ncbi:MAG: 3-oxoacyl-[acyl-carrier protein] reductase, partial [uncultured Thermomicrobiales bacterium]
DAPGWTQHRGHRRRRRHRRRHGRRVPPPRRHRHPDRPQDAGGGAAVVGAGGRPWPGRLCTGGCPGPRRARCGAGGDRSARRGHRQRRDRPRHPLPRYLPGAVAGAPRRQPDRLLPPRAGGGAADGAAGTRRPDRVHRQLGAGSPLAGDRGLFRLQGRGPDAGPLDGAGAGGPQDPRQRGRAGHRPGRPRQAPDGDRTPVRPPDRARHPARRAADGRAGCPLCGVPLLRRGGVHDRCRPAGRRRLLAVPVRGV